MSATETPQPLDSCVCSACLDVAPAGQRYCGSCGTPLKRDGDPAEGIRIASVLFADVADFTRMSARLPLEQTKQLMDRVFERLYQVLLEQHGVVDKYIGDCVMALFGLPMPGNAAGDDAVRAVRAALAMQRALGDLGAELQAAGLPAVRMRIGVESGPVIAGAVGAGPQRRFTVMGPTVNMAAHLQQEAPVGAVLVGDGCQRRIRGQFRLEQRPALSGPAYLVGEERFGGRWLQPRELLGSGGDIVGRQEQLARLRDAFAEVVATSTSRALLLLGSPGIGKTRLAFEFLAGFERKGELRQLVGRAQALRRGVPFAIVADTLRRQLGLAEDAPGAEVEHRLGAMLEQLGLQRSARDLETLMLILEPPVDQRAAPGGPEVFVQRALDLVARLLDRLAERRPTVIVVEDLHLCDGASLQLFGYLLRRLAHRPILLLGLARPELVIEYPQIVHGDRVERLDLETLDSPTVAKLLEENFGPQVSAELADLVTERAQGNPHRVEELLRSFEQSGVLRRQLDGWQVERPPTVPPGDESVARLRIAHLEESLRFFLRRMAVVGRAFWQDAIAALIPHFDGEEGSTAVDSALGELVQRELLVLCDESQLPGHAEYRFSSEALAAVAYDLNAEDELPALHGRVAAWLREQGLGSADAQAELARHRQLAGDRRGALEELRRAGDTAYRSTAYGAAARHYGRALELAGEEDPQTVFELLAGRERVLNAIGRWSEQRVDATRMLALARAEGREDWEAEAQLRVGRSALNTGEHDLALAAFEQAHELVGADGAPELRARALRWRALVHFNRSEHRIALPLFEQALHLAEGADLAELAAELAYEMGVTIGTIGDYSRAVQVSERALEMFRNQQNAYQEAFCLGNLGCFHTYLGCYEAAIEVLERAVALGAELGVPLAEASARANLGNARRALGQLDEALLLEQQARAVGEQIGDPRLVVDASVYEALVALELPDGVGIERARSCAERALELATAVGMPGSEAMALLVLARARSAANELVAAHGASAQAMALLEQIGSIEGFEQPIQLTHIELTRAWGDEAAAQALLRRARLDLLRKASWIPEEFARVRFLGLPEHARLLALAADVGIADPLPEPPSVMGAAAIGPNAASGGQSGA